MPIYEYRCDKCQVNEDALLTMEGRDSPRVHSCGDSMRRLMSLVTFTTPITSRGKILNTLNRDDGYKLPAKEKDRPRIEQALARGLNYVRPLEDKVFVGF